jgi:hypothetical protein
MTIFSYNIVIKLRWPKIVWNNYPLDPLKSGPCAKVVFIRRVIKFLSINLLITLLCWVLGSSLLAGDR